jgi:FSR family fosmidomycin resistance protein-like MFS transporter
MPVMALAVMSHTVVDAAVNILPVILPLLADRFQLSYGQVGVAAALMSLSSSIIQPILGWFADRWRTAWFIPVGIAWTGIFMGCVGLVPNYPMLLGTVMLAGLGSAAFHPIASIAVAEASGARRGFGMSLFAMGGNLGFALGPLMAAWLVRWGGLPGTLVMCAPGCLMAAAYTWRGARVTTGSQRGIVAETADRPVPWRRLAILCALIALRSWGYAGLIVFIPLWLHAQGGSMEEAGRSLFVFLFAGAMGGLVGGILSDRVGRQPIVAYSLIAYPGLMALAILLPGPLRWIALGGSGMTLMASFSVTVVFTQELLPRHLGLASGLALGLAFGAGGLGVAMSGFLADRIGLTLSLWLLLILPGLAGILAFYLTPPSKRKS